MHLFNSGVFVAVWVSLWLENQRSQQASKAIVLNHLALSHVQYHIVFLKSGNRSGEAS